MKFGRFRSETGSFLDPDVCQSHAHALHSLDSRSHYPGPLHSPAETCSAVSCLAPMNGSATYA